MEDPNEKKLDDEGGAEAARRPSLTKRNSNEDNVPEVPREQKKLAQVAHQTIVALGEAGAIEQLQTSLTALKERPTTPSGRISESAVVHCLRTCAQEALPEEQYSKIFEA